MTTTTYHGLTGRWTITTDEQRRILHRALAELRPAEADEMDVAGDYLAVANALASLYRRPTFEELFGEAYGVRPGESEGEGVGPVSRRPEPLSWIEQVMLDALAERRGRETESLARELRLSREEIEALRRQRRRALATSPRSSRGTQAGMRSRRRPTAIAARRASAAATGAP